jgi:hypothetical protein
MVDVGNQVCGRIGNVFLYSLFDEQLKGFIGFDKISELSQDKSWYFWLWQKPGVYELSCHDEEASYPKANFTLRYYPDAEERVFEDFSVWEQLTRLGSGFKNGCPDLSYRKELADSLYIVGQLGILWQEKAISLFLESQDRWVEYQDEGLEIEKAGGERVSLVKEGDRDRNVPGWSLCWEYFDCLVKAFCAVHKVAPSLITRKSYPGKVEHIDAKGKLQYEFSRDILGQQLMVVILPGERDKQQAIERMLAVPDSLREVGDEEITPRTNKKPLPKVAILFREGQNINEVKNPEFVDKEWWRAAAEGEKTLPEELYI